MNESINKIQGLGIVKRIFLLSQISQFDVFISDTIKGFFYHNKNILRSSNKEIPFSEIVNFDSFEDAWQFIIDKEVDAIIRGSHLEQIKWLESRTGSKIIDSINKWPEFIEFIERRHLFAHNDGVVTHQYIKSCERAGYKLDKNIISGSRLDIDEEYFYRVYDCIIEAAIKINQIIWRKMDSQDSDEADKFFHTFTFSLIKNKRYRLAISLLEFALSGGLEISSDLQKRIMVINLAQSHKWIGNKKESEKIIEDNDWTAVSLEFRLAINILKDNFSEAAKIMKEIGPDGSIKMAFYDDWPLFQKFRRSAIFKRTSKEIFGSEKTMQKSDKLPPLNPN